MIDTLPNQDGDAQKDKICLPVSNWRSTRHSGQVSQRPHLAVLGSFMLSNNDNCLCGVPLPQNRLNT